MRIIHFKDSGSDELHEYKSALKEAKTAITKASRAIDTICDLSDDMEDEYGYGERRSDPYRMDYRGYGERYYDREDSYGREWDEMPERRGRDSRGRYSRR